MSEPTKPLPKTAFARVGRLTASRFGAEVTSYGAWFGAIALAEGLAATPLTDLKDFVAKHLVKPYLNYFEGAADAFPALEGPHNAEQRKNMTEDEKAGMLASMLVDYSIKFSAAIAAKTASLKLFDRMAGMPALPKQVWYKDPHVRSVWMVDPVIQIGSFLFLNTAGKDLNHQMQGGMKDFLVNHFGVRPENAEVIARDNANFLLPNLLGFAAGTGYLNANYKKLIDQLNHQAAGGPTRSV